jgi:hypothetical protein
MMICHVQVPRRGALSCDGLSPASSGSTSGSGSKAGRPLLSQHAAKDKRREISRFFGDVPPPAAAAAGIAADIAEAVQQAADAAPDLVQPTDQTSKPAGVAMTGAADSSQPSSAAAAAAPSDPPEDQWQCQCASLII